MTREKIDRRILFVCLFLPEVGDQILKKVGKNSDKLIALAEKEFKANKDVIKKEYQAAGFGKVSIDEKLILEDADEICKNRYYSWLEGKLVENAGQAHIRLHEATKKAGFKLRGSNPKMTYIELISLYKQAYSNPSLNGILGELRTPNDTIKLGEYLTPLQTFNKLIKWSE